MAKIHQHFFPLILEAAASGVTREAAGKAPPKVYPLLYSHLPQSSQSAVKEVRGHETLCRMWPGQVRVVWNKVYLLPSAPPVLQQDEVAALQGQWFAAALHLRHWGFPGISKAS